MSETISTRKVYYVICLALLLLLALTIGLSFVDLGLFSLAIALTIAVTKAALVALYFMHLRYSKHLVWAMAIMGVIWLGIMVTLTLSDYLTRGWLVTQ